MAELRRHPAAPPPPVEIDGRMPQRMLASSRRADVYLYPGAAGGPAVAVKILRDPLPASSREAFARARPRLVRLAEHPSIATVHAVTTTADDRPYLVMEHCSRADLAETTAARPASVPDALRLLIGLCGAVETAHLAGIAHGRVRIENVLTTGYGWPALIGFDSDALLRRDERTATAQARADDVRGLAVAATELLTGRPIADVAAAHRDVQTVPAELEALVLDTLAATETGTGPTAAELALGLQRIEEALHLPITHLDVRVPEDDHEPDDERTVLAARRATDEPGGDDHDATVLSARHAAASGEDERTVLSARHAATPVEDERTRLSTRHAGAPVEDERTRLSTRHASASSDDDRTVMSSRRPADPAGPADAAPADAADAADTAEPTVMVQRTRREAVVRGRVDTARQAVVPDAGTERYRIRADEPAPAITRAAVAPPVRHETSPARPRRRPGRTSIVVVLGAGVLVLGAAATGLAMIIGGGP